MGFVGVITNPNAHGVVRDRTLADQLAGIVGQRGLVRETRTPEELRASMLDFRDRGADIIATCGGDGTNLAVLSEMVGTYQDRPLPAFCVLRGGTVNTVANNLGISGHPTAILGRLVVHLLRGEAVPGFEHDLLRVNGLCGFLFGGAMGGRFFEAYYGGPSSGLPWAAVLMARSVTSSLFGGAFARWIFQPVRARIVVDGTTLPNELYTLLVASTVPCVGLGVHVCYRARQRPGHFHLVATGLSASKIAWQLGRAIQGRRLRGSPHYDLLARRAEIHFAEPQTHTFDGDLYRGDCAILEAGPRVMLLTP